MNYPHSEFLDDWSDDEKPRRRRRGVDRDKWSDADSPLSGSFRSRSRQLDLEDDFGDLEEDLVEIVDLDGDDDDLDDFDDYGIDDDDDDDYEYEAE